MYMIWLYVGEGANVIIKHKVIYEYGRLLNLGKWSVLLLIVLHCKCVKKGITMHCFSLTILRRRSRFPSPQIDLPVPLNNNQLINQTIQC